MVFLSVYAKALQMVPFSVAYALLQLIPILTVVVSIALFKDPYAWPLFLSLLGGVVGSVYMLEPWHGALVWGDGVLWGGGALCLSIFFSLQRVVSGHMSGVTQVALTSLVGVV